LLSEGSEQIDGDGSLILEALYTSSTLGERRTRSPRPTRNRTSPRPTRKRKSPRPKEDEAEQEEEAAPEEEEEDRGRVAVAAEPGQKELTLGQPRRTASSPSEPHN